MSAHAPGLPQAAAGSIPLIVGPEDILPPSVGADRSVADRDRAIPSGVDVRVQAGLERLASGGAIVIYDEPAARGDVVVAGDRISAEHIVLMVREAGGLITGVISAERARELELRFMPVREGVAVPATIEAATGTTTGISAADRARTIAVLASGDSAAGDLISPGHILPVIAASGGLLERLGRIEAALDAVRLAGCSPVAATCTILDADGAVATADYVDATAGRLDLPVVSVRALHRHRCGVAWGDW